MFVVFLGGTLESQARRRKETSRRTVKIGDAGTETAYGEHDESKHLELQRERQSVVAQNRTLQEKVEGMQKSLNKRNDQIANLQRQMKEIAPDALLRCLIAKRRCLVM